MDATRQQLLDFLRHHQVLTVAVVTAAGRPHAAALFYAVDDRLRFYVLTEPSTRHGAVLAGPAGVAGTVQADRQRWWEIQGVQFRGQCRPLNGAAQARGWEIYGARFPFVKPASRVLQGRLVKMTLWRIEPTWFRLIDNRRGFGHKTEWRRRAR